MRNFKSNLNSIEKKINLELAYSNQEHLCDDSEILIGNLKFFFPFIFKERWFVAGDLHVLSFRDHQWG